MLSWASQRQLAYLLLVVGTFLVLAAFPVYYLILYQEPSCFDGSQNQDEEGTDCGGLCRAVCEFQVTPLSVSWTRFFKVQDGVYDIAAHVENRNASAEIERIGYEFKLYDAQSELIASRRGSLPIRPSEELVIFEPNISTGEDVPARAFFEFEPNPRWVEGTPRRNPLIVRSRSRLDPYVQPRLEATIFNDSLETLTNVTVAAVVFDGGGNAVAASETAIDAIGREEEANVFFSWQAPIARRLAAGVCTAPTDTMLVFDRSGSMESDRKNPPQPLTNAKNAAQAFVERMGIADKAGLVTFATRASRPPDQGLTSEKERLTRAIGSISIGSDPEESGYTNLGDAFDVALAELLSARGSRKARRAIIALTDGDSNRPKNPADPNDLSYPEWYAAENAAKARKAGVSIYAIGLGTSISEAYLKEKIASGPEFYYAAPSGSALEEVYQRIARDVCTEETFAVEIFTRPAMLPPASR